MNAGQDDLTLQTRAREALSKVESTISYGMLARALDVSGPGSIARVTAALEALMRDDFAAGRPFLSAKCEGKLTDGLPALGFFQLAIALGRYSGPPQGPEAFAFVQEQRALLRN